MYSIKINYGLPNGVKIFTTEKELKKAFSSEKEFNKYVEKIKKEAKKAGQSY